MSYKLSSDNKLLKWKLIQLEGCPILGVYWNKTKKVIDIGRGHVDDNWKNLGVLQYMILFIEVYILAD